LGLTTIQPFTVPPSLFMSSTVLTCKAVAASFQDCFIVL
jgi:hypothetical protein